MVIYNSSMSNNESMQPSVTIVSAADAGYFWGLYLLAASVAKSGMGFPMNLLIKGFNDPQRRLLEQFDGVTLHEISDDSARNLCMRKAEAFSHAETDYIAWLDSDCVVVGDISELIIPMNGEMQMVHRARGWPVPSPKPGRKMSAKGMNRDTIRSLHRIVSSCTAAICRSLPVGRSRSKKCCRRRTRVW